MSERKNALETFMEGLLQTRSSVRSLLPENCTQRQAEHHAQDLSAIFQTLGVQFTTEASAGRWWLVLCAAPAGSQKATAAPVQRDILAWLRRADG